MVYINLIAKQPVPNDNQNHVDTVANGQSKDGKTTRPKSVVALSNVSLNEKYALTDLPKSFFRGGKNQHNMPEAWKSKQDVKLSPTISDTFPDVRLNWHFTPNRKPEHDKPILWNLDTGERKCIPWENVLNDQYLATVAAKINAWYWNKDNSIYLGLTIVDVYLYDMPVPNVVPILVHDYDQYKHRRPSSEEEQPLSPAKKRLLMKTI